MAVFPVIRKLIPSDNFIAWESENVFGGHVGFGEVTVAGDSCIDTDLDPRGKWVASEHGLPASIDVTASLALHVKLCCLSLFLVVIATLHSHALTFLLSKVDVSQ